MKCVLGNAIDCFFEFVVYGILIVMVPASIIALFLV